MSVKNKIFYEFVESKSKPETYVTYPPSEEAAKTPLIIDNGSYQFRAGWGSDCNPALVFKNILARNRGNKKDRDWDVLVGNDIPDLESVRWMIRTAFDFNVVVNFSVQETILDHAFSHLGINTEGHIPHPILMTEPIVNPPYSRKQMSELLFEAYSIPKLSYGVDNLFSFQYNKKMLHLNETALVVCSGFQSTHVLPIMNNKLDVKHAKRINLGGYNNGAYLQRLLQLKFPKHSSMFTLTRMDNILSDLGSIPVEYTDEIKKWADPKYKAKNTTYIKIHNRANVSGQGNNPPSERQILTGRKLRQMEYKLYDLECILELEENPDAFCKAMSDAECVNVEQLQKKIKQLHVKIAKLQRELNDSLQESAILTEIPIGVEKHQGLEILFKPSMVGYEQAGVGEVTETILAVYPPDIQEVMAKNVLITGGNSQHKGFAERIEAELVKCRPFGSDCRVHIASDPSLDAWKGARQWAMDNIDCQDAWMYRNDFEEKGWDYMIEHDASNVYLQMSSS